MRWRGCAGRLRGWGFATPTEPHSNRDCGRGGKSLPHADCDGCALAVSGDAKSHGRGDTDTHCHKRAEPGANPTTNTHQAESNTDSVPDRSGYAHANSHTPAEPVEATPAATPAPLLSAEELGFREIDTEEALAQAGLTFVEYGPGEAVPWEAGLYLLDVETGEVEGWIIPEGDAIEETDRGRVAVGTVTVNVGLSPGNRFLLLTSDGLHDRLTGRTYTWSAGRLWPVLANYGADLVGWVLPDGERLIFQSQANGVYLVVDSSLSLLAQFQLRAGWRRAALAGRRGPLRLRPDAGRPLSLRPVASGRRPSRAHRKLVAFVV